MTGFGSTSRFKLKKTDEFSSVFNFRKRISGAIMIMHYMPNVLGYPRLGIIVGKKSVRSAVRRNYMKRVLRELFRQSQHTLGGVDILVKPRKEFVRLHYAEVNEEFSQLLAKLRERSLSEVAEMNN